MKPEPGFFNQSKKPSMAEFHHCPIRKTRGDDRKNDPAREMVFLKGRRGKPIE
jgi:hypothetical protein